MQSRDMRKLGSKLRKFRKLRNLNCALPDFFLLAQFAFVLVIKFFGRTICICAFKVFFSIAEFGFAYGLFKIQLRFTCALNFL